jgi:hypothetical protein
VNGKQIPSESLSLDMSHEKTSDMGYTILFEGSGIHHSNSGLQVTRNIFINGFFLLLYDLTPDLATSEGRTSSQDNGSIRIELKFSKTLPEVITSLIPGV